MSSKEQREKKEQKEMWEGKNYNLFLSKEEKITICWYQSGCKQGSASVSSRFLQVIYARRLPYQINFCLGLKTLINTMIHYAILAYPWSKLTPFNMVVWRLGLERFLCLSQKYTKWCSDFTMVDCTNFFAILWDLDVSFSPEGVRNYAVVPQCLIVCCSGCWQILIFYS